MRVISRLDIKNNYLIKGLALEGLRQLGAAKDYSKKYYEEGADEIVYIDNVASLYSRDGIFELLRETVKEVFIPITVGGGIRNVEDAYKYFMNGADKIFINTAAVNNPKLIDELVTDFGSANVSLSIEAKKNLNESNWEVYTSNGRDNSKKIVIEWAKEAIERGVGEIFLTSIDNDGFQNGFDSELVTKISEIVSVPLVISGGFGALDHLDILNKKVSAIAIGSSLHYKKTSIKEIKSKLEELGYETRK